MRKADPLALAALTATALLLAATAVLPRLLPRKSLPSELRCVVDLGPGADSVRGHVSGYAYHLFERFAGETGHKARLGLAARGESWLDSLKAGRADVVAVHCSAAASGSAGASGSASAKDGGLLFSEPIDSLSVWAVRSADKALLKEINAWIESWHASPHHNGTRERFMHPYDPRRRAATGRRYPYISPYDDIIKEYADSMGWDWHLLAAVIWQESHFKIDVRSRRGASGLMQMMPKTADRMEASDLTDPRESIRAGSRYLKMLEGYYYKLTRDPAERRKYTLAAYNAGHGRIRDCVNLALLRGKDVSKWAETASVIPEMNSDDILQVDTVKLGRFKGRETVAYVENVFEICDCFRRICP